MGLGKYFEKANAVRRSIREILGIAFWLHSLHFFGLIPLPSASSAELPRYLFNAVLIVFIINYSLFTDSGWWSVIFDFGYMYALPFVYVVRVFRWMLKSSVRSFKSKVIWQNPNLIPAPNVTAPSTQQAVEAADKKPTNEGSGGTGFRHRLVRIFFKFSLLWALLILTVNWRPFLCFAILVSTLGACRAIIGLWGLFSGNADWVDRIEGRLEGLIQQNISKISEWDGRSSPEEIRTAMNALKLYGSVFNFVSDNSSLLSSWAFSFSIAVSLPFYCYVSFLYACVYFGISKVFVMKFSLSEALIDSLFMPLAWSALPNSLLMRFIGGLQGTFILIIGYNALFRHLGNRLDRITKAATKLRNPFERDSFRDRLSKVEALLSDLSNRPKAVKPNQTKTKARKR